MALIECNSCGDSFSSIREWESHANREHRQSNGHYVYAKAAHYVPGSMKA